VPMSVRHTSSAACQAVASIHRSIHAARVSRGPNVRDLGKPGPPRVHGGITRTHFRGFQGRVRPCVPSEFLRATDDP
jgi:hypothetical protein